MTDTDRHLAAIVMELRGIREALSLAFQPPQEPQDAATCCEQQDNQIPLGFQSTKWRCAQCGKEGGE